MKNRYVLSFLLISGVVLHAMENKQNNGNASQSVQLVLPDWKSMHNRLEDDYQGYLKNRLKEYKKTYIITTSWNMDELVKVGEVITKQDAATLKSVIYTTRDEEDNVFLHYAVEKNDESTVQWILSSRQDDYSLEKRKDGQTPFDLCIKKLLPEVDEEKKVTVRKIFDMMLAHIAQYTTSGNQKSSCLSQIIDLQLKYIRVGTEFIVEQDLLQKLVPNNSELSLSNYYQKAQDEKGFTFAHALVEDPDKLFELIKKNYVSFAKDT